LTVDLNRAAFEGDLSHELNPSKRFR